MDTEGWTRSVGQELESIVGGPGLGGASLGGARGRAVAGH